MGMKLNLVVVNDVALEMIRREQELGFWVLGFRVLRFWGFRV